VGADTYAGCEWVCEEQWRKGHPSSLRRVPCVSVERYKSLRLWSTSFCKPVPIEENLFSNLGGTTILIVPYGYNNHKGFFVLFLT